MMVLCLGLALLGILTFAFLRRRDARPEVELIREATSLKETAAALQAELRQFKEGGFDRLIGEKLGVLVQRSAQELESRERIIQQASTQLVEVQRQATSAAEQFKVDLGAVKTQLEGLRELQRQVSELNDLLKPQQFRGELGEVIVRTLIADKLPRGQYDEDHTFSDGKRVEFVIRLNGKLIPVDSKLQLEAFKRLRGAEERQRPALRTEFRRTVRQKIDEVKQYIRPSEGTYNFALMVIPSEAVYYDLLTDKEFAEPGGLYEYACAQNVFLVSPMTFWAYLTAMAHGLRGLEIERRAEEILAGLQTLATRLHQFAQDEFRTLGGHLRNASSQYERAERKLQDLESGLESLEHVEASVTIEREVGG